MTFRDAVQQTPGLESAYCEGLQALRARDREHIVPEDPRQLGGSVDIDTAYQKADPQANRWDYGIAYQHSNRDEEVVYWVEIHTASTSEVSVVLRKLAWLRAWLKETGHLLDAFERDFVWVSSGSTDFILTAPQKKQMALAGLRQVGNRLRIPNNRPG